MSEDSSDEGRKWTGGAIQALALSVIINVFTGFGDWMAGQVYKFWSILAKTGRILVGGFFAAFKPLQEGALQFIMFLNRQLLNLAEQTGPFEPVVLTAAYLGVMLALWTMLRAGVSAASRGAA